MSSTGQIHSLTIWANIKPFLDQEYVPIQDSHSKSAQPEMSANLIIWSNRSTMFKNYNQITQATLPVLYKIINWFHKTRENNWGHTRFSCSKFLYRSILYISFRFGKLAQGNCMIVPVPMNRPGRIWVTTSHASNKNSLSSSSSSSSSSLLTYTYIGWKTIQNVT